MSLFDFFLNFLEAPGTSECAGCGQTIQGARIDALGKAWHPEHFRCTVCDCRLPLAFRVGPYQEPYCSSHTDGEVICSCCGHVTASTIRTGRGAVLCRACGGEVIRDLPAAIELFLRVQRSLRGSGLPWWPRALPLRLATLEELNAASDKPRSDQAGLILIRRIESQEAEVTAILALRGLPRLNLSMVLAHELGHAWVVQHRIAGLPLVVEEGFCEYCSYLWLTASRDPRAPYQLERLVRNPDPVYGDGYRRVSEVHTKEGIRGVLTWLGKQSS